MEIKLDLYEKIRDLPSNGSLNVKDDPEIAFFIQRELMNRGYVWRGKHSHVVRTDCTILAWKEIPNWDGNGYGDKIILNVIEETDLYVICKKIIFSKYYKVNPKYEGFLAGRQYGI